MPSSSLI